MAPEQTAIVTTSEPFDVEAELASFVADPCRKELRLPHMTTGQRRRAKLLAEKYPELACQSYGLGQDRQLYFFKPDATRELKRRHVPESRPNDAVSEFEKSSMGSPVPTSAGSGASTPTTRIQSASQSPSRSIPEALPEFFQVRNTFIHIEETSNDRIVRSMPHDMFSKCLLEETAPKHPGFPAPLVLEAIAIDAAPSSVDMEGAPGALLRSTLSPHAAVFEPFAATPSGEAVGGDYALPRLIEAGAEVMIEGLTKCPAFNGRRGIVESFDEQTERYNVLLNDSQQLAKLKSENLRVTVPPPPSFEAPAPDFAPSFPSTPTWEEDHHPYTVLLNCAAR